MTTSLKLAHKLQAAHPGTVLKWCYEAGPRGFALCRCLQLHDWDCILVCPSKVPRKGPASGSRLTGGMPTVWLWLYQARELTSIYVAPEPVDEAMRGFDPRPFPSRQATTSSPATTQDVSAAYITCVTAARSSWTVSPTCGIWLQNQNALRSPANRLPGNA